MRSAYSPLLAREMAMALFLWLGLVVATIAVLASGWDLVGDVRGATVDAEAVSIKTNVVGRRLYDIRLVTLSGRTCVTLVDSGSNPQPREIRVGATSRVHYSANDTCADYSVRESTHSSPTPLVVALSYGLYKEHRK
jgi:hypothetical protein